MSQADLSSTDAERLRAFEREGHDALANSYHAFFAPVTALATDALFDHVRLRARVHACWMSRVGQVGLRPKRRTGVLSR